MHGVLRNHGGDRSCDGRRCRHRQRDGAWPHQRAARRSERARDAAATPDQDVRLRHHRRHRRRWRAGVRLRQVGEGHGFRGAVPGGGRDRRVGDSRGPAGNHYDHARDRRSAHGPAQCRHPTSPGGGDARLGIAHLLRQDRHAHPHGNDGGFGGHRRVGISGHRRWLCAGGRGQEGRKACGQAIRARPHGACLRALQRR